MKGGGMLPSSEEELPHLWQKPAYTVLLECLKKLHVEPRVWSPDVSRANILNEQAAAATAHDRREIISFLSTIIKSSLAWLDNDDEREVIWDEASKRMSERCGRTGMSESVRAGVSQEADCPQRWARSPGDGPLNPKTTSPSA